MWLLYPVSLTSMKRVINASAPLKSGPKAGIVYFYNEELVLTMYCQMVEAMWFLWLSVNLLSKNVIPKYVGTNVNNSWCVVDVHYNFIAAIRKVLETEAVNDV